MTQETHVAPGADMTPPIGLLFEFCIEYIAEDPGKHYTQIKRVSTPAEMLALLLEDDFTCIQFFDWCEKGIKTRDYIFSTKAEIRLNGQKPTEVLKDEIYKVDRIIVKSLRTKLIWSYRPHFDDIYRLSCYLTLTHAGLKFESVCHQFDNSVKSHTSGSMIIMHHVDKKALIIETDCTGCEHLYGSMSLLSSDFDYYDGIESFTTHRFVDMSTALEAIYDFIGCDPDKIEDHPTGTEKFGEKVAENFIQRNQRIVKELAKIAKDKKAVDDAPKDKKEVDDVPF